MNLEEIKKQAIELKKVQGISHCQALHAISQTHGFKNYQALLKANESNIDKELEEEEKKLHNDYLEYLQSDIYFHEKLFPHIMKNCKLINSKYISNFSLESILYLFKEYIDYKNISKDEFIKLFSTTLLNTSLEFEDSIVSIYLKVEYNSALKEFTIEINK